MDRMSPGATAEQVVLVLKFHHSLVSTAGGRSLVDGLILHLTLILICGMPTPRRNAAKIRTLRQQGILNPHPDAVTDPLFQTDDFFDPQDLMQVKYEMLRRVEIDKASVTEAAAVFGLSRPAFYQAQHAVAQQGLAGLIPRKRGPHGGHKLTPAILDFIRQQRTALPSLTIAELIALIQQQFGVVMHRRTVERHLAQQEKKHG